MLTRSAITVDPRSRSPSIGERHDGAAAEEIVPLLPVDRGEKFLIVDPVELARDAVAAVDDPGIASEAEQSPPHRSPADQCGAGREESMPLQSAHQGSVGEQESFAPTRATRPCPRPRAPRRRTGPPAASRRTLPGR